MSQTSKIVLGVAVVAVILLGAYYYWHNSQKPVSTGTPENAEVTTLPSGSSTTDAALEQDLSSIDSQIHAVGTDNANASQSVNAAVSQ